MSAEPSAPGRALRGIRHAEDDGVVDGVLSSDGSLLLFCDRCSTGWTGRLAVRPVEDAAPAVALLDALRRTNAHGGVLRTFPSRDRMGPVRKSAP